VLRKTARRALNSERRGIPNGANSEERDIPDDGTPTSDDGANHNDANQ
jgi:hypothetical protein